MCLLFALLLKYFFKTIQYLIKKIPDNEVSNLLKENLQKDFKLSFLQTQITTAMDYLSSMGVTHNKRLYLDKEKRFTFALIPELITKGWRKFCKLVSPATIVYLHRKAFKFYWKIKSSIHKERKKRITQEVINYIKEMTATTMWGAKRIMGELLKIGFKVCKRTVQKYMRDIMRPSPYGKGFFSSWKVFLKNHLPYIFAVDFTTVFTLNFKVYYVIFFISLKTRKIIHYNITPYPDHDWVKLQLKNAFFDYYEEDKIFLIRDNDNKLNYIDYKMHGITDIPISFGAPDMNAYIERFIRTVKHECLDHFIFFNENHIRKVLSEYIRFYNSKRPHQGIDQNIPSGDTYNGNGKVKREQILNGLHYHYYRESKVA